MYAYVSILFLFSCSDLVEGSVRLDPSIESGSTIHRVEILYDGRWGTICSTNWDVEDATVVCNTFGRGPAEIVDSSNLR